MPTILPRSGGCALCVAVAGAVGAVAGAAGAVRGAAGAVGETLGAVTGAPGALRAGSMRLSALAGPPPSAAVMATPTLTVTIVAARTKTALRRERTATSASVVRRMSRLCADHDTTTRPGT